MPDMKLHFLHDARRPTASEMFDRLASRYGQSEIEKADTVVALGGDGTVLYAFARAPGKTVFGLLPEDARSLGFWVNRVKDPEKNLIAAIERAKRHPITPVRATVQHSGSSGTSILHAFNEVAVIRDEAQAFFAEISGIYGGSAKKTFTRFAGDGVYLTTPMGSTGGNYSYGGPGIALGLPVTGFGGIGIYQPKNFNPVIFADDVQIKIVPVTSKGRRPIKIEHDGETFRASDITSITLDCDHAARTHLALAPNFPGPWRKLHA